MSRETELRECPNLLQLRPARLGITGPSKLQRLQSCKTEITAQKKPAGDNTEVSREDILVEIHNTQSVICCCSSQLRSAATITRKTATVFKEKYA
jgi:hypothetical protein